MGVGMGIPTFGSTAGRLAGAVMAPLDGDTERAAVDERAHAPAPQPDGTLTRPITR